MNKQNSTNDHIQIRKLTGQRSFRDWKLDFDAWTYSKGLQYMLFYDVQRSMSIVPAKQEHQINTDPEARTLANTAFRKFPPGKEIDTSILIQMSTDFLQQFCDAKRFEVYTNEDLDVPDEISPLLTEAALIITLNDTKLFQFYALDDFNEGRSKLIPK